MISAVIIYIVARKMANRHNNIFFTGTIFVICTILSRTEGTTVSLSAISLLTMVEFEVVTCLDFHDINNKFALQYQIET